MNDLALMIWAVIAWAVLGVALTVERKDGGMRGTYSLKRPVRLFVAGPLVWAIGVCAAIWGERDD